MSGILVGCAAMRALRLTRLDCVFDTYNALEKRNIPIDWLSARHTFRNWTAGEPLSLIPVNEHLSILEAAAAAAGSPFFGLEAGMNCLLSKNNVFGRRVLRCPTLHDALNKFCQSMPWYASSAHLWLHETRELVWICRGQQRGTENQQRLQEQRMIMRMINLVRLYAGRHWTPRAVHLIAGPSPRLESTDCFADTAVHYCQRWTAIAVPRYMAALPFRPVIARFQVSTAQVDTELRATAPAGDFAGTVEQVIQALQPVNGSTIEDVAEMAGCSVRSLQRRLAREGVRYSDLVKRARFNLAVKRLIANDGPMIDIAFDLGYADQSHFSRAFRRWAGMSPLEFRRHYARMPTWNPCDITPAERPFRPTIAEPA
jgi:AraC-like DNA-binding protein